MQHVLFGYLLISCSFLLGLSRQLCQINSNGIRHVLTCKQIPSNKILQEELKKIKCENNQPLSEIVIEESGIIYLPQDAIFPLLDCLHWGKRLSIRRMSNSLAFISEPLNPVYRKRNTYLLNLKHLKGLHSWNWESFDGRLNQLEVTESRFVYLPDHFGSIITRNLPVPGVNLEQIMIKITKSELKWLGKESLDCTKCEIIELSSNKIDHLPVDVFGQDDLQIKYLTMEDNQITNLVAGVFSKLVYLISLDLTGNKLVALTEEMLPTNWENMEIRIDTKIPCTCDLIWANTGSFDLTCTVGSRPKPISFDEWASNSCGNYI